MIDWQKEFNEQVNRLRAPVECAIAYLKYWCILYIDYWWLLCKYVTYYRVAVGLYFFKQIKVAAGLFDEAHNPMWTVTPSHDAAKALLAFWRRRAESGEIVHDFTDPDWNTRFLGDLYQDLSEHAKKTYALLQTPEFVEEFILDYTLTPAIEEFGLTPDPPEARPDLPSSCASSTPPAAPATSSSAPSTASWNNGRRRPPTPTAGNRSPVPCPRSTV